MANNYDDAVAELSDETIAAAQVAVKDNEDLRGFLREHKLENNPHIVRAFAENPNNSPQDNLAKLSPIWAEKYNTAQRAMKNPHPKRYDQTQVTGRFGSFLKGDHLKGSK